MIGPLDRGIYLASRSPRRRELLSQVGVRYHLSDRFVLRADYSLYTAFVADTHSAEYRAFTAGVSFFF